MVTSCLDSDKGTEQSNVFDLSGYAETLKGDTGGIKNVVQVGFDGEKHDTMVHAVYSLDSIVPLIQSFDFNRRERGGEFIIKTSNSNNIECTEFRSKDEIDIIYMTVCKKANNVISLSGAKRKNSLLGVLLQSYHFDPEESFELRASYIDKINTDTVVTVNHLFWHKLN